MRYDLSADRPTSPFNNEKSVLIVTDEKGFGTINLDEVDLQAEVKPPSDRDEG